MKTILTPNMVFYGNNVLVKVFIQPNNGDNPKGQTIIKLFIEHSNGNNFEVLLNKIFYSKQNLKDKEMKELEDTILRDMAGYISKANVISWKELKKIIDYHFNEEVKE